MIRTGALAAALLLLLTARSSTASSASASSVEKDAASLVVLGAPAPQWVPVDLDVIKAAVGPDGQRTTELEGVPVLLRADPGGVVTDAITGWMRIVPAAQAAAACSETEHWAALAEEKFSLVSAGGGPTVSESCASSDLSGADRSPITGACSPSVKGGNSTCLYIGVDPLDGGEVRVDALLTVQHIPS